jgi:hypothetical protein
MARNNADFQGINYSYSGKKPYNEGSPSMVHHFEASHHGSPIGFLQLFDSGEVANIEVDHYRKGIGSGLINFAKSQGFSPKRSDAESEEGEGFFDRLQEKGLIH